nr:hypothetical protein CTI12_AA187700 [Tanacetum cinerariifolium]
MMEKVTTAMTRWVMRRGAAVRDGGEGGLRRVRRCDGGSEGDVGVDRLVVAGDWPEAAPEIWRGSSPAAYKTMKEWHEQADLARASLDKTAKKMKKWADEKRRHIEFEVGDQVMVKLLPHQFKTLRMVHKGLIRRYEGPFPVIGRIGKVSYRVQLSPKLKIHLVFHVSFLKPYHGDEEEPERGVSKRVPTAVVTSYDWEVEEILSDRTIRRRGVPIYKEYLIKWCDLPDSEASWEMKDLLWQFTDKIKRYHEDGTMWVSRA